jgi:2-keto-4-pentenoate hydratase/2-oxohepta-3-ene-1,7-dioic acid hydratase in catechol pathway
MKLIRCGPIGREKPGVQTTDGKWLDVSSFCVDYNESFFHDNGIRRLGEWLNLHETSLPEFSRDSRLGSCVARPSKIVCVGLNYTQHALESGMAIPDQPILFFKSTTALCGPFDPLIIPPLSEKTDWEVELAVVIGKKASYVQVDDAIHHVAGYALHNDYSERAYQLEHGGQWVKGKSCDSFAPIGPFLATTDEIPNPHKLQLWLKVNGIMKQNANTSDLIFNIPTLISYISKYMTLLPGDIISTGTPPGVGLGFQPPQFLRAGDIVELSIDGLGTSSQRAVNYPG